MLLLDTGANFLQNFRKDRNFALVAEVADSRPPRFDRVAIAVVVAVAAIAVAIADVVQLFTGAALASAAMLAAGCLSGEQARRAVKWDVLVTIAAAFGISNALEGTGAPSVSASRLARVQECGRLDVRVVCSLASRCVMREVMGSQGADARLQAQPRRSRTY